MGEHTKGPWFVWKDGIYAGPPSEMTKVSVTGYRAHICDVDVDCEYTTAKERKANATLIASAPALAAEVERLREHNERMGSALTLVQIGLERGNVKAKPLLVMDDPNAKTLPMTSLAQIIEAALARQGATK